MTDISLSLGGKWLQQSMEREQQAQVIAHLTNQLEGLKSGHRGEGQRRHTAGRERSRTRTLRDAASTDCACLS